MRNGIMVAALGAAAIATTAHAREQEDVVFHWRKTVSNEGVQERTLVGDLLDWLDAGGGTIDLDTLEDSEGRRYEWVADAGQASETSPVVYEVKLVRTEGRVLSRAEVEAAWLENRPGATLDDLEAFRRQRDARALRPPAQQRVARPMQEWIDSATPTDRTRVTVRLRELEGGLDLPRIAPHLFDREPALALDQLDRRLRAIERRKNLTEIDQAPVLADLLGYDGELLDSHWIINGFDAEVGWAAALRLVTDPRVERIDRIEAARFDDNDLEDMRVATQVTELHDAGFEGERASGSTHYSDMCMAIIDSDIDMAHPAWLDGAGGRSRLQSVWRRVVGFWFPVSSSATTTPSHGTKVAGVAMADLTQGQDPSVTSTSGRQARTGFAPEASFVFVETGNASIVSAIERAVVLSPDVINLSSSYATATPCDRNHSANDAVDEAMLAGIFFAKSGGNNGNSGSSCVVGNPGAASGAFTVNQLDRSADPLKFATASSGASRGGDSIGRAVVGVAAVAGPELARAAQAGGGYGVFGASSSAAPAVAGTALCLKEHLIARFGSSIGNEVGFLYATMLVLADGQLEDGTLAGANDPMDEVYGAGRMRMRVFDASGMDAPWRMRLFSRVIDDGEISRNMYANPDSSGVNRAVPTDVERLRVAAYWHEPNIEFGSAWSADIRLSIRGSNGFVYSSGTSVDPRQRIHLGNVTGGTAWTIRLTGEDVPVSLDRNHYYRKARRKVFVAMYWEDMDRDDANGPSSDID